MEVALFGTNVSTPDRFEIEQILEQRPVNFNQANKTTNFVIALALNIIKVNFTWKCVSPAEAPDPANLCRNWDIILA